MHKWCAGRLVLFRLSPGDKVLTKCPHCSCFRFAPFHFAATWKLNVVINCLRLRFKSAHRVYVPCASLLWPRMRPLSRDLNASRDPLAACNFQCRRVTLSGSSWQMVWHEFPARKQNKANRAKQGKMADWHFEAGNGCKNIIAQTSTHTN